MWYLSFLFCHLCTISTINNIHIMYASTYVSYLTGLFSLQVDQHTVLDFAFCIILSLTISFSSGLGFLPVVST